MRIRAALAGQPQLGQALQERRADLRPLPDQHQRLRIPQAPGRLRLAALPGDVFARIALDLRARLDGPAIAAAYAEGCPGYMPQRTVARPRR